MIICTVGKIKSGKSKLADIIQEVLNIPIIEVSSLVKQFAMSKVRKDLQLEKENHKNNPNWLYDKIKEKIECNCIVSGIREQYLLDQLKKDFENEQIIVIAAQISNEERQRRAMILNNKTKQEFLDDELRDNEFDIDKLITEAHYSINTELSLEATTNSLHNLINELKI